MTKDKLNKLLKDYDDHRGSGDFSPASEFKEKFFEAAKDETAKPKVKHKSAIWLIGTITAIAAALLFVFVPLNMVTDVSVEKINQTFANGTCKLMRRLKSVFPEKSVGLCLINGELKTFEANEDAPRNIMINYSIQRKSDGKEIKLSIATSSNNSSELNSTLAKGSIWVYQPDNKVLTVDTDLALQLDAKTTITINESNLLKLNQKQFVSEFEYQGRKYKIFQSACRI
jgi:hypothetical protein